jgi:Cytochrome C and Quinol oxidase polypeptide I
MYFAIAYQIWPVLTGREHASLAPLRLQLWLWFIGMMVMTLHWHYLGLQGQWRRVANFDYTNPIIASWGPLVLVSLIGGIILLASALLFARNLIVLHRGPAFARARPLFALAVHPPERLPAALNGFGLWNVLVLILMIGAYAIAQFFISPSPGAMVHHLDGGARRAPGKRTRGALAHLGWYRRRCDSLHRSAAWDRDNSRPAGPQRRAGCVNRHLPRRRNKCGLTRRAAAAQHFSPVAGVASEMDAGPSAGSRARRSEAR